MKKIAAFALPFFFLANWNSAAGQSFFNIDTIQEIELFFSQPDWDYLLDTAKQGSEETYLIADSVRVNGIMFDSVGVKYKGNSTYNPDNEKNPMHIELNTIHKNADYKGNADIKLGNGTADPSFVREPLSFEIVRKYMDAPRSNFARLHINGEYYGLYTNTESINSDFLDELNYPDNNLIVKCNPKQVGPGTTSNLGWISADSTKYFNLYEIKSDYGWKKLVQFIDTLVNKPAFIEQKLDIDKALWMHAVNDVMVNLDSYTGIFSQNYYLYEDGNRRFAPVMWDFNMSFGGFPLSFGPGGGLTAMQQLIPLYQATASNRPLISKLLADARWKKMYLAHLRTITEENFATQAYVDRAETMMATIQTAVEDDTKKFYTTADFSNSLDQTITGSGGGAGGFSVPGIRQLMAGRVTFLQANADYKKVPPALGLPVVSPANPVAGSTVWVTASAPGATFVRLGWRPKHPLKFEYIQMLDDGLNGDGAAGDGVFGALMPVNSILTEYFVWAENADAGIFSPVRAEYDFHLLTAQTASIQPGEVVINEFLATNTTTNVDPNGEFDDWIELYNNSPVAKNLDGFFLSDSWTSVKKWEFPAGTVIQPGQFLLVWADGNTTQAGLHTNFKLSGNGENLALTSPDGLVRVDSIKFSAQTADKSTGRCPDGTGAFSGSQTPTPAAPNCGVSTENLWTDNRRIQIQPNPANDFIEISGTGPSAEIRIFNAIGQLVFHEKQSGGQWRINVADWPAGLYFLKSGYRDNAIFVRQ